MLRRLGFAAGAAALLDAGAAGTRPAAAQSKMNQLAVDYQGTPKGAQRCDNCTQWQPPASCKVVSGAISPAGWCSIYVKNSG
jgi:hypothetical protein